MSNKKTLIEWKEAHSLSSQQVSDLLNTPLRTVQGWVKQGGAWERRVPGAIVAYIKLSETRACNCKQKTVPKTLDW